MLSEGVSSQYTAFKDATMIFDELSKRNDIDNKKVISMGFSLGAAVSTYLSDNRPTIGTILVSPFENASSRIQPYFPLFPMSILMKQTFDSSSRAPSIDTPLLCLIGDMDTIVSPESSLRLANKWKGPHTVKRYKYGTHGSLLSYDKNAWTDIKDFLKAFE